MAIAIPSDREGIRAVPYEKIKAGKPPIPITVAPPPPSSARLGVHPLMRPTTSPDSSLVGSTVRSRVQDDVRRDSGLATSSSTARESRTTLATDPDSTASIKKSPSLPRVAAYDGALPSSLRKVRNWSGPKNSKASVAEESIRLPDVPFLGITTHIPTSSLEDLTTPGTVEFSNRGSMLIGGKRLHETRGTVNGHARVHGRARKPSISLLSNASHVPARILSADDEVLSQKVRSMYESGTEGEPNPSREGSPRVKNLGIQEEDIDATTKVLGTPPESREAEKPNGSAFTQVLMRSARPPSFGERENHELAGGIEDWHEIGDGDVDRYGFIVPKASYSRNHLPNSAPSDSQEPPRLQRVSTSLQLASEAPRKSKSRLGRSSSVNGSARSAYTTTKGYPRPMSSQSSQRSTGSRSGSRMRSATNRLPYNRERRYMDEAGDMLTLPPGLADIAEHQEGGKAMNELKRKEWAREEKWRKMAKVVKSNKIGGGMSFEFDTKNAKLIERTWKGIPDRWRATAWHAFLSSSAKQHMGSVTDEELIAIFHELIHRGSPDDVQIDIDVPRTINCHIMFRRRYRGGQRLLFRVLHCLSIYFPDTGYVQGMAALAATFLCYFEEEMAFVMLVRMWQLRGLARLYQSGFDGLMEALNEFEKKWLDGGEVAVKLVSPWY